MKKFQIFVVFLFCVSSLFSQRDNTGDDDVILYKFGTDFTLGFYMYNQSIFFEFIPGLSFFPTYWMSMGTGYYYQYRKIYSNLLMDDINVHGIRTMVRFHPIPQGCIHFEYRFMTYRTNIFNDPTYEYENIYCHALIAGIGFTQAISERFFSHTLIMMDFLSNYKTPYSNPILQTTFEYRFNLPKSTEKNKKKK